MDIFSVPLEQSIIQCSLPTCNLRIVGSELKGQKSIGTITQTDIAKTEFRKMRKQRAFSIWKRPILNFQNLCDCFCIQFKDFHLICIYILITECVTFSKDLFISISWVWILTSNCKWKLLKSVRPASLHPVVSSAVSPSILFVTYIMVAEVFVLKWAVSLINV